MKTETQMRAYVMRRVYAMYYARQLKKPATRVGAVGALVVALANMVSITSITANAAALGGLTQFAYFVVAAFVGTTLVVQAVSVGLVALIGWFSFDALRKVHKVIAHPSVHATAH